MKKPFLIITILILTVMTMSVVRIYIANQIATSGVMLEKVQQEVDAYKTENIQLSERYYSEASLTTIDKQATKLGFIEPTTNFVLNGQVPVAYKQ